MPKQNLFIAIEGTDGSGKSTQAKLLAERLTRDGHNVHTTFEPTDRSIGKLLRRILKGELVVDQKAIAGLFLADRLDHLLNEETGLVKKLADGYSVICDRYYFSSYAYHSVYMDMDWVIDCNSMCADILRPDLNVFIDVPVEVCIARIQSNRASAELYETGEILNKVRNNYLAAFDRLKGVEQIAVIDGNRSMNEVAEEVWSTVGKLVQ